MSLWMGLKDYTPVQFGTKKSRAARKRRNKMAKASRRKNRR